MANNVKKVNGIAIADIKKINGQTDDDLAKLNGEEFEGIVYTGDWHGPRFVALGVYYYGGDYAMADTIQYKAATSTGNAADWGAATQEASGTNGGASNGTRVISMNGET